MVIINHKETANINDNQEYELPEEADVEFGQLPGSDNRQIPGYLPVLIVDCPISLNEIKFFGVNDKGAEVSGSGVKATSIDDLEDEKVAYFNMNQLVKSGQYTESTVEGVITINNQEIGRQPINQDSAIYLG